MNRFNIQKIIFLFMTLLLPMIGMAEAPAWQIVPDKSSITFTATQNNSPVSGQFKSFIGEINLDPEKLSDSHVNIVVDIGSVTTSYEEIANTLKTTDWFDVKLFPQAIFKANNFAKVSENAYQAHGTLTIRDKTLPIVLNFTLEEYSKTNARAKGSVILKRTAFGIGKGEWANTDDVKDDVQVNFVITVIRK